MREAAPEHGGEPPPAGSEEGPRKGHEALLRTAFAEGAKAYGPLPLSLAVFGRRVLELTSRRFLRAGIPESRERIAEALSTAPGADLYLAIACEERISGAWETFARRYLLRLKGLAMRLGASASEAEEIVRDLPGDLIAPPSKGGSRTRLGTYDGTGSLFAWLAVIVSRRVADRSRAAGLASHRTTPPTGHRPGPPGSDRSSEAADPCEILLQEETRGRLEEALEAAWKGLTRQESLALRWRFRMGLPQTEIARLLGVDESRVSRILGKGVDKIRTKVRRILLDPSSGGLSDPEGLWSVLRDAVEKKLSSSLSPPDPRGGDPLDHADPSRA